MTGFFGFRKNQPSSREAWLRKCLIQNESNLIRYVKSLTHNLELSKDIVQEAFLKLWEQEPEKVEGHETQWLFKTCRNRSYDHLRKKDRHHISADDINLNIPDSSLGADDVLSEQDDQLQLQNLLKLLSPTQREILNMKFELEMSYKEISEITGLSVNHVGVLIHKIVTKLKENITKSIEVGDQDEN